MSSYIDTNLTRNEKVRYRAQISWWSQTAKLLSAGLLFLIGVSLAFDPNASGGTFIFIALLVLGWAFLAVSTTELALTNQRVIAKTGWIRRQTVELRNEKVEAVVVDQGILGRMLNYGSIIVKGTGGANTPIPNIKDPLAFRMQVNELLDS